MQGSAPSQNKQATTLWTPANIVTLVRILLVPVFFVAFVSPWPDWFPDWSEAELLKPWLAALLFVVLACTDALDGYLARSRGEVTNFGKFMDPLADKILVAAALLAPGAPCMGRPCHPRARIHRLWSSHARSFGRRCCRCKLVWQSEDSIPDHRDRYVHHQGFTSFHKRSHDRDHLLHHLMDLHDHRTRPHGRIHARLPC